MGEIRSLGWMADNDPGSILNRLIDDSMDDRHRGNLERAQEYVLEQCAKKSNLSGVKTKSNKSKRWRKKN